MANGLVDTKPHSVQKLRVIFDKLHRILDLFISLYDMHAKKNLEKINLNEKKNTVPARGIEPGTAQISQKQ